MLVTTPSEISTSWRIFMTSSAQRSGQFKSGVWVGAIDRIANLREKFLRCAELLLKIFFLGGINFQIGGFVLLFLQIVGGGGDGLAEIDFWNPILPPIVRCDLHGVE